MPSRTALSLVDLQHKAAAALGCPLSSRFANDEGARPAEGDASREEGDEGKGERRPRLLDAPARRRRLPLWRHDWDDHGARRRRRPGRAAAPIAARRIRRGPAADRSGASRSGAESRGADRGGADRGGADRGGADRGGAERGGAERGGARSAGGGAARSPAGRPAAARDVYGPVAARDVPAIAPRRHGLREGVGAARPRERLGRRVRLRRRRRQIGGHQDRRQQQGDGLRRRRRARRLRARRQQLGDARRPADARMGRRRDGLPQARVGPARRRRAGPLDPRGLRAVADDGGALRRRRRGRAGARRRPPVAAADAAAPRRAVRGRVLPLRRERLRARHLRRRADGVGRPGARGRVGARRRRGAAAGRPGRRRVLPARGLARRQGRERRRRRAGARLRAGVAGGARGRRARRARRVLRRRLRRLGADAREARRERRDGGGARGQGPRRHAPRVEGLQGPRLGPRRAQARLGPGPRQLGRHGRHARRLAGHALAHGPAPGVRRGQEMGPRLAPLRPHGRRVRLRDDDPRARGPARGLRPQRRQGLPRQGPRPGHRAASRRCFLAGNYRRAP